MKYLFLASSFATVAGVFAEFVADRLQGGRVAFIPTASINEEVTFYVEAGRKALEALGLSIDVLELSSATPEVIQAKLAGCDCIYVSGGNVFFLLRELRRTGADRLLVEQIVAGKPYVGESAGAVVLAPHLAYIRDMDDLSAVQGLDSLAGLGLIDFYPLPHYTNAPFQECAARIEAKYRDAVDLYPFSNHQAILMSGDTIRIANA
ncbi:MAG TPA: Type 1 glutamine amidotransferase-like domain-containing protein [Pseudomonas sp.]|uniref:Type 1 glutamine amidotransferase-like domain-containing protein n=1 Tax=Pseudomonas sp. TaxID=306 RepID=UPI002D1939B6|nr:Type 1 glutamine amidotransferase-like domain-containing protein [Pseudomonas sp.]HTO18784.1 Type 1 glutamine amidotransferase-like domain-containing protein [Pseudomonas sp.]